MMPVPPSSQALLPCPCPIQWLPGSPVSCHPGSVPEPPAVPHGIPWAVSSPRARMPAGGSPAPHRGSHCRDEGVREDPAPFYLPRASCHSRSTLSHSSIKLDPTFPGDSAGNPHTNVSLAAGSSPTQHHSLQTLFPPLGHAGTWWLTDLRLFPQHQPQLPLPTSLSPSCPQPLALTMECCRPLALAPSRSRCLHCTQQLSQDFCQDHCL